MDTNILLTNIQLVDEKLKFKCSAEGRDPFFVDYFPPLGNNEGHTSLELVQIAITTCVGTAIAVNLRKMGRTINSFHVSATGNRQIEHPTKLTDIEILFTISSPDVKADDMEKALAIADKICPVTAMVKGNVNLTFKYLINN